MWIEIGQPFAIDGKNESRPVRALWIEMGIAGLKRVLTKSRPVRALWIEMPLRPPLEQFKHVEAREGLVD